MSRWTVLAALAFTLAVAPGFVCASRVERIEGDVDALRLQFVEIQQRLNSDQTQITEMILRADAKLAELEELQKKANDLLTRNSVDLSLQIDTQRSELAELRGRLDVVSRDLDKITKELAAALSALSATGSGSAVVLPKDKDELYAFAEKREGESNWPEARVAYQDFVVRFASDTRAAKALYKTALCYQNEQNYKDAIASVRSLLTSYPDADVRNDAIWVMGESAFSLKNCEVAIKAFETLVEFGDKKAKKRLSEVKSACK